MASSNRASSEPGSPVQDASPLRYPPLRDLSFAQIEAGFHSDEPPTHRSSRVPYRNAIVSPFDPPRSESPIVSAEQVSMRERTTTALSGPPPPYTATALTNQLDLEEPHPRLRSSRGRGSIHLSSRPHIAASSTAREYLTRILGTQEAPARPAQAVPQSPPVTRAQLELQLEIVLAKQKVHDIKRRALEAENKWAEAEVERLEIVKKLRELNLAQTEERELERELEREED